MTLTVEDGTIVAGADSYVTLPEYQAYGADLGWTLAGDDADEINLRRAFQTINRKWSYRGELLDADQVGAFPRTGMLAIPRQIREAQYELAYLVQDGLDPFSTIAAQTTAETIKVGPITISEETLPSGAERLRAVDGLLRSFVGVGAGQIRLERG